MTPADPAKLIHNHVCAIVAICKEHSITLDTIQLDWMDISTMTQHITRFNVYKFDGVKVHAEGSVT